MTEKCNICISRVTCHNPDEMLYSVDIRTGDMTITVTMTADQFAKALTSYYVTDADVEVRHKKPKSVD